MRSHAAQQKSRVKLGVVGGEGAIKTEKHAYGLPYSPKHSAKVYFISSFAMNVRFVLMALIVSYHRTSTLMTIAKLKILERHKNDNKYANREWWKKLAENVAQPYKKNQIFAHYFNYVCDGIFAFINS